MRHNRLLQSSNVCWSCIVKQRTRHIHSAGRLGQYQLNSAAASSNGPPPLPLTTPKPKPVRQRLQDWQAAHGNPLTELLALDHADALSTSSNWLQQLDKDNGHQNEGTATDTSGYDLSYARGDIHEPGDLIELSPTEADGTPPLCIFVRQVGTQIQLITSKGKWMNVFPMRVMSSIPAFVDASLIPPILPFLPSKEVEEAVLEQGAIIDIAAPRTVTSPLISALAQLKYQADEVYRHNAAILDSAHDILAHPTDLRFGGLQNIADKLLGTGPHPTLAQLYAVRKAIHYAGIGFYRDPKSHKTTGLYQIRSKEQLQQISLARDWLRQYQEVETTSLAGPADNWQYQESKGALIVKGFLDKCKQRILTSRKTRSPTHTGNVGPSSERYPVTAETGAFYTTELGPPFTDDERVLVKFMEGWAVQNFYRPDKSLRALAPLILRGTGMYQDFELRTFTAYTFLQEIGVYDPWANHWLFDVNLLLPTSQHSKPLERLATELSRMTSRDVNMKDSMADLRHDWKDLQAFAIDSAGSQEIDDAISVQRIEGSSTEFWVHVHIANPTAFLERNDVFSKMAMHLTETLYMPEMVYPLLPAWMSQEKFSLKSNRPCLTFSTRINLEGEVFETKVRPGILRNVLALEYDQLPDILGTSFDTTKTTWSLVVGGKPPTRNPTPAPKISSQQTDDLKLLQKLAQGFAAHRERKGAVFFTGSTTECSVYWKDNFGLPAAFPRRKTGIITHGDPIIELRGRKFENPFSFATRDSHALLVQEMMTLANYAAATWCNDRNIPILYRGMGSKTHSFIDGNKELLQPAIEKHGFIPIKVGAEFFSMYGRAMLSPVPIYHHVMGLEKYTKVTSPLRRFGDMMAHWQIEAAIREESRRGVKSLLGASAHDQASYLPYSKVHIDKMITRVEPRERLITKMKNRAVEHWQCLAFQRAIEFGEAPFPRRAAVAIMIPSIYKGPMKMAESNVQGRLVDSSIKVQVKALGDSEAAKVMPLLWPGDVWECEYVGSSPMDSNIYYRPIQLIRKEMDPE